VPFEEKDRRPGNLVVLSGKNGKLLARAPMPDGKETYMSPVAYPIPDTKEYKVIIGPAVKQSVAISTSLPFQNILRGDISNAKILDSCRDKGYIGPPVWIDITDDGTPELLPMP